MVVKVGSWKGKGVLFAGLSTKLLAWQSQGRKQTAQTANVQQG